MKSILLKSITVLMLFISAVGFAQDFQGKAIYQTKTTLDIDFENSGIPADRIKMMQDRMKSQLEKTFELTFDKTASIYKEEVMLDQSAGGGRGGFRIGAFGGGTTGDYYKNTQTKTVVKESEFSGKNFLIKDVLKDYEWKMEQETKMIGENMCFKATTTIEIPVRPEIKFGRRGGPGQNNRGQEEEEATKEEAPKTEEVVVTAWYALNIPVSQGPSDFWGLPGLILEVSYGNTNILCTKIVINPKDKIEIKEPKKGKEVSQAEYDKIIAEKMKEMEERFRNERQKGGQSGGRRRG
ncbi:GLPGLI family protein [Lutibacter sp. A80]|uniref:GLPGLI family protein n=1 Tax=Lutibacter sp. A80 TaxID=2918453 RepID=UPI001F05CB68|nr:GLPGLI family protein [Lutibacter sp. A80]UMB60313.1 GLPGLI family protein [Lutibacter sp. A80]